MRKIMLLAVLLGLVVFVMPIYVQAAPPGGVPPGQGGQIGALNNKIDAEEAARIAADAALQGAVDAEEAARIAADAALQGAVDQEIADRKAADQDEGENRKDADLNIEAFAQEANDALQTLLEQAIVVGDDGVAAAAQTARAALGEELGADLDAHAADASAHHVKTANASELTTGTLPQERIANNSILASKLAANSVNTSEIVDGAVTSEKLSSGFIQDLLGLEIVTLTTNIGSDGFTTAIPDLECPAGKTAIACGFQTNQEFWHIEGAQPLGNKCQYSFTTCVYEGAGSGGGAGFRCRIAEEPVHLSATCVNDSAISP